MSWKTSLCGGLAMLATALAAVLPPAWIPVTIAAATVLNSLGNMFARDNDKSSEQVGAGNTGGK